MEKTIAEREKKISDQIQIFSPEEISIIKATVAKGFTDLELAFFLNVSKVYKLNPFTKQIWAYKDIKGNIIVFAGRDGFLAIAQKTNRWSGIASCEVREGERFEMNVAEGIISHRKDVNLKTKILGAYAICMPRGCEIKTIEWADFDTYNKGINVWKADPVAMIKKVAESHCLAKAYGITGLAVEEDFEIKNNVAITKDHEEKPGIRAFGYADELVRKSNFNEDTKDVFYAKLADPEITNIELENIMNELKNNQPKKY